MATTPIDLSAGLVPKQAPAVDLSAGLVPKGQGDWTQGTANWQKAVDQAAQVEPYAASKGFLGNAKAALNNLGAGAVGAIMEPIAHPLDTLKNMAGAIVRPTSPDDPPVLDTKTPIGQQFGRMGAQLTAAVPGVALIAADPEALAAKKTPGVVGRVLNSTAEKMYGTAMKPATTLSAADRAQMIRTGLDNSLRIDASGVEKLGNLIDDLNQKIKGVIDTDPNRPIDPNAVATRADISKARFANQVNATKDLNSIENSRQQFLTERGAKPGSPAVPPQPTGLLDAQGRPIMSGGTPATAPKPAPPMRAVDAQAMKQGTYAVLREKYGEQGAAAVEAQKNLAMGLKEELATQFPELSGLNAAESKLLDLGPILERAVNRVSNNHTIGIGGPILGSAIKAGTGSSGAAAVIGVMKSIVDMPAVKSRLAISLSKAAKIPYPQALGRVSAYSASLQSALHDGQAYSPDAPPTQ